MADIVQLKEDGVAKYLKTHVNAIDGADGYFVKVSGDESISGNKNFVGSLSVKTKRVLTIDDLSTTDALWAGISFLSDQHTITPSKGLRSCEHGWVLKWNNYNTSSGSYWSGGSCYSHIPKQHVETNGSGMEVMLPIFKTDGTFVGAKSVIVSPASLKGKAMNAVGALYGYVLTNVFEY